MGDIVSFRKYQALKELEMILPLELEELELFVDTLEGGKSLAKALKAIGLKSAYEISPEIWKDLRPWHKKHYITT